MARTATLPPTAAFAAPAMAAESAAVVATCADIAAAGTGILSSGGKTGERMKRRLMRNAPEEKHDGFFATAHASTFRDGCAFDRSANLDNSTTVVQ